MDLVENVLRETKHASHAHIAMVVRFKHSAVSESGIVNNE